MRTPLCCNCSSPWMSSRGQGVQSEMLGHCCLTGASGAGIVEFTATVGGRRHQGKNTHSENVFPFPPSRENNCTQPGHKKGHQNDHVLLPCRTHCQLRQGPLKKGPPHLRGLSPAASPDTIGHWLPCFQKDVSPSFPKMFPSQRWAVRLFLEFSALGTWKGPWVTVWVPFNLTFHFW